MLSCFIRPRSIMDNTPGYELGNGGSIPSGGTKFMGSDCHIWETAVCNSSRAVVQLHYFPPSFVRVLASEVTLQRLLRRTNVVKGKGFESPALKSVSSKWWTYWMDPK
jgi:hypothetical protein